MPLINAFQPTPPFFPPPRCAAGIRDCVEYAELTDPYGHATHLILACVYLGAAGLSTAAETVSAIVLLAYTAARGWVLWRALVPLLASPLVALLVLWLTWAVASGAWAPNHDDWKDALGGFRGLLMIASIYPLRRHWRALCGALIAGMCLQACIQILQAFGMIPIHGVGNELRPAGLHSHPVHVAVYEAIGVAFIAGWIPAARSNAGRAALVAAAILLSCGIALAAGRAAILGLALGLPVAATLLVLHHGLSLRRLLSWTAMAASVLVVAGGVVVASGAGGLKRQSADLTKTSDVTTSTGQRFLWWKAALTAYREHPIRGCGTGASREILRNDPDVQAAYRSHLSYGEGAFFVAHPHSAYVQTLCEQGLVGIALFASIIGLAALGAWRSSRDHPIVAGAAAGLVVWAVAAAFDGLQMAGRTASLACILLTLGALPRRHRAERPPAPGAF